MNHAQLVAQLKRLENSKIKSPARLRAIEHVKALLATVETKESEK